MTRLRREALREWLWLLAVDGSSRLDKQTGKTIEFIRVDEMRERLRSFRQDLEAMAQDGREHSFTFSTLDRLLEELA